MLNANQPPLSQAAFDEILDEHTELVRLTNELELRLYELGEQLPSDQQPVENCRQAASALISRLRSTLFRFDQQIYPLLDPEKAAE